MGHARALLGLEDDAERVRLGRLVAERGLSVRETEKLVRKALTAEGSAPPAKPPELAMVTEILRTTALHVQLHQRVSGAGKLIVEFSDASARDVIVAAIKSAVEE
jgi:ParB family transcriptional regulator, chromosome partitioning protein